MTRNEWLERGMYGERDLTPEELGERPFLTYTRDGTPVINVDAWPVPGQPLTSDEVAAVESLKGGAA